MLKTGFDVVPRLKRKPPKYLRFNNLHGGATFRANVLNNR